MDKTRNRQLRILVIHTFYGQAGGEDAVFNAEAEQLETNHVVKRLTFRNSPGVIGLIEFIMSIWNRRAYNVVSETIESFYPDIIHIHNVHFSSGPVVIRACKRKNIPLVVTLHNYRLICPSGTLLHANKILEHSVRAAFPWRAVTLGAYRNSRLLTFWLAFVNWFHKQIGTWKLVDQYVVLTDFARDLFLKSTLNLSRQQFVVKPNGTRRNDVGTCARSNHFLFVGRLSEEKGISTLLEAFEGTGFHLRIAGDGPLREQVVSSADSFKNIRYIGSLDRESLYSELAQCSALIFPSIWFEGMPMTILEAYSMTTPVIASNIGAMSSLIVNGSTGLHFDVGNSIDLRAKVNHWQSMDDRTKSVMYARINEFYTKEFTLEVSKQNLEDIYFKLLNREDKK